MCVTGTMGVGWPRRRRVWRFRRRNGRDRGGARTWRRSRVGDGRYRLRRYRCGRRRFWHWRCCHSTPATRGAAGNPRRCLADHAGVLGDPSWGEIRLSTPIRGERAWATLPAAGRGRRSRPGRASVRSHIARRPQHPCGFPPPPRPADSVTEAATPVSVMTAGCPGSRPAVSQTRRWAMPSPAAVADGWRQNGSSATSSPSGGRSEGEAVVGMPLATLARGFVHQEWT